MHIRLLASNSRWSVRGLCNFYVVQATSAKCGLDLANVKLNAQSEECISTRTTVCVTLFFCTTCAIKTCNVQPRPGCFLISNVSSGNITLCHEQHLASELQVERCWSVGQAFCRSVCLLTIRTMVGLGKIVSLTVPFSHVEMIDPN